MASITKTLIPLSVALVLATSVSSAEDKIGKAATIKNHVEGILDGPPRPLSVGSEVFSNELVRTSDGSTARLVFLDNTDLTVGPQSEIRLDKFIYDPKGATPGGVIVQMARGAFRFVTGAQDHRNYTINTPYATLGVRGTIFEVVVTREKVDIHLLAGGLQIRTFLGQLVDLEGAANSLTVLSTGEVIGPTNVPANKSILNFRLGGSGAGGGGSLSSGETTSVQPADLAGGAGGGGAASDNNSGHPGGAPASIGGNSTSAASSFICLTCSAEAKPIVSVAPVPGPIAGAGLPGLALACCGLLAWARRRLSWRRAAVTTHTGQKTITDGVYRDISRAAMRPWKLKKMLVVSLGVV